MFNEGFIEDTNFENLEVLEEANVENAEQHDRFKVITCKAVYFFMCIVFVQMIMIVWS